MPALASPAKLSAKFWQGYSLISRIASWLRQPWSDQGLIEALQLWLGDDAEPSLLQSRAPNGPWTRYRVTVRTKGSIGNGVIEESVSFTAFHADPDLIAKVSLAHGSNNAYQRIHFGPPRTSHVIGALLVERSTPISAELQYELVIEPDLGSSCH